MYTCSFEWSMRNASVLIPNRPEIRGGSKLVKVRGRQPGLIGPLHDATSVDGSDASVPPEPGYANLEETIRKNSNPQYRGC